MLACGVIEESSGEKKKMSWLPKKFQESLTEHAIVSIIHLAECLNVNPQCIGIKTAIGDVRRRFHAG